MVLVVLGRSSITTRRPTTPAEVVAMAALPTEFSLIALCGLKPASPAL
jgi:hypothetical protein